MQVNLKTLPQNKEAEQAVLGSILIDQNAMNLVLEEINEDDFYDENHKKIFSSMVDLEKENKPIDILTLYDKLKTKKSLLKEVGGSSYLSQLVEIVPSSTNVSFYAKSVKEKSVLRSMIKTASEIIVESQTDQVVVDEFVDEAEKKLFEISQNKKRSGFVSSAELAKETLKIIENLTTRKQAVTGVSSGFKKLDKMTSGFQNSDLIIIAARPGMGKTSFSLNILMHAALVHGLNVGFFSLEMAKEQLMMRMLSAKSKINFGKIRTGFLSDAEFQKTVDAATSLQRANIFIDDTPAINSLDLRSRTRRLQTDKGIDLLIVDYLQLMRGTGRTESREREIAEMMKYPLNTISSIKNRALKKLKISWQAN